MAEYILVTEHDIGGTGVNRKPECKPDEKAYKPQPG
jgi:hypothetical protein